MSMQTLMWSLLLLGINHISFPSLLLSLALPRSSFLPAFLLSFPPLSIFFTSGLLMHILHMLRFTFYVYSHVTQ